MATCKWKSRDSVEFIIWRPCSLYFSESLVYYQTVPIVDSSTYQITVETITDVPGDTASSTLRLTVPAQPPGTYTMVYITKSVAM